MVCERKLLTTKLRALIMKWIYICTSIDERLSRDKYFEFEMESLSQASGILYRQQKFQTKKVRHLLCYLIHSMLIYASQIWKISSKKCICLVNFSSYLGRTAPLFYKFASITLGCLWSFFFNVSLKQSITLSLSFLPLSNLHQKTKLD